MAAQRAPRSFCVGGQFHTRATHGKEPEHHEYRNRKLEPRSTQSSSRNCAKSPARPWATALKALQETKGNMEEAFVVLRKRGMASAAKKGDALD